MPYESKILNDPEQLKELVESAVMVLKQELGNEKLLALQELMDASADDPFFNELCEVCVMIKPDLFGDVVGDSNPAADEVLLAEHGISNDSEVQ